MWIVDRDLLHSRDHALTEQEGVALHTDVVIKKTMWFPTKSTARAEKLWDAGRQSASHAHRLMRSGARDYPGYV